MDLLGVRPTQSRSWRAGTSRFRSFSTRLPRSPNSPRNSKPNSTRSPIQLGRGRQKLSMSVSAPGWLNKFTNPNKVAARERAWPGIQWRHYFVHGVVKYEAELTAIQASGITLVSLHQVLTGISPAPMVVHRAQPEPTLQTLLITMRAESQGTRPNQARWRPPLALRGPHLILKNSFRCLARSSAAVAQPCPVRSFAPYSMKNFDLNIDKILENWEVFHAVQS